MDRYSLIHDKFPREFILLQGRGCKWRKCAFCDYYTDVSESPYEVNKPVLQQLTGVYGVVDVINSGSAMEMDEATLVALKDRAFELGVHTLWFEAHYMYRHRLEDFAARFAPIKVKFRCGIETFDARLRTSWNKGVAPEVTAADVARYFSGVCLLCCTEGDSRERILKDIALAEQHFEYFSVNVFCENTTSVRADKELVQWFAAEVYPQLKLHPKAEVLLENTDLGVGE